MSIDNPTLRQGWFDGYLSTVVLRDVASFAQIQHGQLIPRLLGMLAARAGGPTVISDLAKDLQLNHVTTSSATGSPAATSSTWETRPIPSQTT